MTIADPASDTHWRKSFEQRERERRVFEFGEKLAAARAAALDAFKYADNEWMMGPDHGALDAAMKQYDDAMEDLVGERVRI
jgi:hypothetical protein